MARADMLCSGETANEFCVEAAVRPSESFDTQGLAILRLCKTLRGKLMPLLVSVMDETLTVFYYNHTGSVYVANRPRTYSYALHLNRSIAIPLSIRTTIRVLDFDVLARFIPDPLDFPNLVEVKVRMGGLGMEPQEVLENNHKLLLVCRTMVCDNISDSEKAAAVVIAPYANTMTHFKWLIGLMKELEKHDTHRDVRVILYWCFGIPYRDQGWVAKRVVHDVKANFLTTSQLVGTGRQSPKEVLLPQLERKAPKPYRHSRCSCYGSEDNNEEVDSEEDSSGEYDSEDDNSEGETSEGSRGDDTSPRRIRGCRQWPRAEVHTL